MQNDSVVLHGTELKYIVIVESVYFVYFNNYLNTCITLPKIIIFIISLFNFIIIIHNLKKCGFNNENKDLIMKIRGGG